MPIDLKFSDRFNKFFVFSLIPDTLTFKLNKNAVMCLRKSSSRPKQGKKVNLLKHSVNTTEIYINHRYYGTLSLLHVDYWAYTTKRELLQTILQLVFVFSKNTKNTQDVD